ncbi:MAG: SRPBCC family protein [Myxococcota bacterium]
MKEIRFLPALCGLVTSACSTSFHHTHRSGAAPAQLWARWTEVEQWPQWDTELEYSHLDGAFEAGTKGRLKAEGSPESRFVLTEVRPERGYIYEVKLPLAALQVRRRMLQVEPSGPVSFEHAVRFKGFMGWFFSALLKKKYERALPGVMERLAAQAELEPSPEGSGPVTTSTQAD